MLKRFIPLLATLLSCNSAASLGADTTDINRLAELCKVWGKIKVFNPDASINPGRWDTALMRAIPLIRAANDDGALSEAYEAMLASIGDSRVTLVHASARSATANRQVKLDDSDPDHIRIIAGDIGNISSVSLLPLIMKAPINKQLILDLRSDLHPHANAFVIEDSLRSLVQNLFAHTHIELPAKRKILYTGYKPQNEGGSMMYQKSYKYNTPDTLRFSGSREINRPIIFILNRGSLGISRIAGALRSLSLARVIVVGNPPEEVGVDYYDIALSSGASLRFNATENAFRNGNAGFVIDTSIREFSERLLNSQLRSVYWKETDAQFQPEYLEKVYSDQAVWENEEMRLLSLFRLWNVMEYYFPYKHLMDVSWDQTLLDMIPKFIGAHDESSFNEAILLTVARLQDDHVGTSHPSLIKMIGGQALPLELTYVNREPVIKFVYDENGARDLVRRGDKILAVNGIMVDSLRAKYKPLIAASTPQGLDQKLMYRLLYSNDNQKTLTLLTTTGERKEVKVPTSSKYINRGEDSLPVYKWLDDKSSLYYMDLTRLEVAQVNTAYNEGKNSRWLVLDMRGYPRATIWPLSRLLAKDTALVARYKMLELCCPDSVSSSWTEEFEHLHPTPSAGYDGQIIVLINENAISQSEHSCLFLKALGRTTFIGTPTRGTNGDVTNTTLPGGYRVNFTGLYVGFPDGTELQRQGIKPDIVSAPTVKDIELGRDAVLVRALQYIKETDYVKSRR